MRYTKVGFSDIRGIKKVYLERIWETQLQFVKNSSKKPNMDEGNNA
ncbi:hypothetical protein SBF1_270002 [Candidatus Desulfosporosinus infrequens]|uniref:Uncharacterized protein n=1 Tax=Candidatus Desulfosporosinus infrequens TaxID=2043169 RepID=A0A2U3KTT5_9FIRM|nr:hypothetical protein SBF1_270002 [Candidatus Desulfosporosinus infrequens]